MAVSDKRMSSLSDKHKAQAIELAKGEPAKKVTKKAAKRPAKKK